jgi:hypothetical protein
MSEILGALSALILLLSFLFMPLPSRLSLNKRMFVLMKFFTFSIGLVAIAYAHFFNSTILMYIIGFLAVFIGYISSRYEIL